MSGGIGLATSAGGGGARLRRLGSWREPRLAGLQRAGSDLCCEARPLQIWQLLVVREDVGGLAAADGADSGSIGAVDSVSRICWACYESWYPGCRFVVLREMVEQLGGGESGRRAKLRTEKIFLLFACQGCTFTMRGKLVCVVNHWEPSKQLELKGSEDCDPNPSS